jgi:hypothetical protein
MRTKAQEKRSTASSKVRPTRPKARALDWSLLDKVAPFQQEELQESDELLDGFVSADEFFDF